MGSYSFVGSSGSSTPVNVNASYEDLGYGTDGSLTLVTGGAVHVKGTYVTLGTTANAWAGFELEIGDPSNAGNRHLIDIKIGGVAVVNGTSGISNIYAQPAVSSGRLRFPMAIAAGQTIEASIQSSTASGTLRLAATGRIANANTPPMFTTCTTLTTMDTAATRAAAGNITLASTLGTWTQLVASTGSTYGALLAVFGDNGTTPATAQQITAVIGTGAAPSEVALGRVAGHTATSSFLVSRMARLFETNIGSGTRIVAAALATTPGTDAIRAGLYGFA
jgi:hypothetical protein